MRKSIIITLLLLATFTSFAQTYNSPESIEYDYTNNRWLIANNSGNNILARNTSGVLSYFVTSVSGPHGLEIVDDTLYVCSGSTLKAYNLTTAAPIFSISLGASFLNGITHDANYLYITDFSAKKIYRFDLVTRAFTVFITGLAKSPNGIIYDQPNNRCVFVNWGTAAPIMAFDITTAAVSTITTTTLGNCDGIAKDAAGNYYVSSWSLNGISRFNNTFTGGPTTVVTGLSSPADIFYNVLSDTLGVPNSGSGNNTTYHYFGVTAINESSNEQFSFSVNPNPVISKVELTYELKEKSRIKVSLCNVNGSFIKTILEEVQERGIQSRSIILDGILPGNYLLLISNGSKRARKKIIVVY